MVLIYGLAAAHPGVMDVLAQTAKSTAKNTATSGFSSWFMWIILGVMFIAMYFILYRPQRKKAQEAQNLLSKLRKGDDVVTIGGIHGTIVKLTEDTVVLEIDKGVRMTFSRTAISRTLTVHEEAEDDELDVEEEPEMEEEDLEEPEEYEEYEEGEEYEEELAADESGAEEPADPETGGGGGKGKS